MFIFQILLGLVILAFELFRKKAQIVDVMAIFSAVFFICYVISPISGYFMLERWQEYSVMRYTIVGADYESSFFYYTGIISVFSYLVLVLCFTIFRPRYRSRFFNALFLKRMNYSLIFWFGIFLFLVSFMAILISSLRFGGLVEWMVANPRLYFDDDAHYVDESSWGLDKLSNLMLFSSYLFWGLFIIKRNPSLYISRSTGYLNFFFICVFLFLSLLFSSAVVIHSGGRLVLFKFFATFFIANMYISRSKFSVVKLSVLVLLGSVIALYGRLLFKYFLYKDFVQERVANLDDSLLEQFYGFINNYTFAFYSANHNLKYGIDNFRLFGDLFTWPLQFLPPSIRPEGLPYTTQVNTFRLMNLKDTGLIPSDILSYGIINGHVIGVFIVSALFGVFLKFVNSYSYKVSNPVQAILYVALAFVVGFRVMYFDPAHLFKGSFDIIVGLVCVALLSRIKVS